LTERLEEAQTDFEKCVALNPDFVQAKIQLAYCIYKKAQLMQSPILAQNAMEEFEKISKENPTSPDALGLHAQVSAVHSHNIPSLNGHHYFALKCAILEFLCK